MIAVLVPSKGRPEQFKRMVDSIRKTTSVMVQVHAAVSFDDCREYNGAWNMDVHPNTLPDWMPTAHKWNLLAEQQMKNPANKLFMLGADDMIFSTPLWAEALLEHYAKLENKIHVYAMQDSRDEDGTPHIIVTREYIEAMEYMVPPIFLHWVIDTWTVRMAKYCDVFTHMKDYLLAHDKPSDRGFADATHTGIRSQGWHDRDRWVAEKCESWLIEEQAKLRRIVQRMAAA